jgi:hypothetical protein
MSDVAHAYVDTDADGKTIVRANTESHSGHTLTRRRKRAGDRGRLPG